MQIRVAVIAAVLAATLAAPASAGISKNAKAQKVIAFMDMVFNQKKVKEGFDKYVGDKYIQHNPIAPDGKEAAVDVLGKALQARGDAAGARSVWTKLAQSDPAYAQKVGLKARLEK